MAVHALNNTVAILLHNIHDKIAELQIKIVAPATTTEQISLFFYMLPYFHFVV